MDEKAAARRPAPGDGDDTIEFVSTLYRGILDREPDKAGLHFYAGTLRDGALTKQNLIKKFIQSVEFRSRLSEAAGMLRQGQVADVFRALLDREPESEAAVKGLLNVKTIDYLNRSLA